jgi:uncharacterized protein YjbJ (UPF0337 family)
MKGGIKEAAGKLIGDGGLIRRGGERKLGSKIERA